MTQTYTRQSSFSDGDTITAALFNNEFNQLVNAFAYSTSSSSTGHQHDGSTAEGGNIHTIGDLDFLNKIVADSTNNRWGIFVEVSSAAVEQIRIQDGAIVPVTDNDIDLGTSSVEFKDAYFDGTVTTDALTVSSTTNLDGAIQVDNTITVGVDDTGYDVKFFGDTASAYMLWDTSADDLVLAGAAGLDVAGDIDVDGTSNLDNTDIDGTLAVDGTTISLDATTSLNIDNSNTSNGITIGTATSGVPISIGHSTSEVTINDNLTVTGTLTLGSGAELAEAELEMLDGITAGTVAASKAVVVDSNKDAASFRNITLTGELDAATLDISGNADIDGTTNLDAVDIDGATQIDATVTVGVDDTGYDVKFFGATSGAYMLWDESADDLKLVGAAGLTIAGNADIDGTLEADAYTVDGTALNEYIADTVGAMVSSNTETNITVTYEDGDNTLDFVIGTLNQDTTGTADNITVSANNSTDETVYPIFVDGATGSQGAESDTGLTYNPSSGLLTSTLFAGTLNTAAQGNITSLGTLTTLTVDDITINGSTISDSGDLSIDVGADLTLDAGGGDIILSDDGTIVGTLSLNSSDFEIRSRVSDKDLIFKGNDGGSEITALTLDMSAAGAATFNDKIVATELDISGNVDIDGTLEADAYTVDGTALATYIRDTVGTNMLSSNTESGITVTYDTSNDNIDFAVDAAQTGITSLLATDIKIGEDDQTKIDFETADEIHFYAANAEQVYVADGIFGPQTDSDVDLGSSAVRWKDAYVDSLTTTGALSVGGNLTVNGTTTTVNSTTVTIDDPIFTLGGDSTPSSDDNKDRGIEFKWHNGSAAKVGFFGYDDSTSAFTFIPDASNSSEVFSGTAGAATFGAITGTTGTFSGVVDADAGITVDNITIDGTEIDLSSGNLTLDVAGEIYLDADDGIVRIRDDGGDYGMFQISSSDFIVRSMVQDKDLLFKGNDNGSVITALTLDMSEAGTAQFNHDIEMVDNGLLRMGAGGDLILTSDGTNGLIYANNGTLTLDVAGDLTLDSDSGVIDFDDAGTNIGRFENSSSDFKMESRVQDKDIVFVGNDGGSGVTALTLDMSDAGTAIFNHDISVADGGILMFGNSSDLQLYHDGSNSYILDQGTGDLNIRSSTTLRLQNASGDNYLYGTNGGEVVLYHNNSPKLYTASGGVDVTGAITATASSTITTADNTAQLQLISTDADANSGPQLDLYRNSSSPADGDDLGRIYFYGENNAEQKTEYVLVRATLDDMSDDSEDSSLAIYTYVAGSQKDRLRLGPTETAFNESSVDLDFRVESNGNANMLFVDGGNDHVSIGTATDYDAVLNILSTDNTKTLSLVSTDTDANAGPILALTRQSSSSAADNDYVGEIKFEGLNDANQQIAYAGIAGRIVDASDGTEDGRFEMYTELAGAQISRVLANATETVINQDSADLDFRVEGNARANLFYVDGGKDMIGIGMAPDQSWGSDSVGINFGIADADAGAITWQEVSGADHLNFSWNLYNDNSNWKYASGNPASRTYHTNGAQYFQTAASGSADANVTFIDNLKLTTSENVFNEGSVDLDFRVESNGNANMLFVDGGNDRIHIGTGTNVPVTGINPPLQISGTDYASSTLGINRFSNDDTAPFLVLGKSRGTSVGSYTSVSSGDIVGAILGVAADGTDMASNVARIDFAIDTTPGGNDTPGRIVFNTTADGATGVTEHMRITSAGSVGIGTSSPEDKLDIMGGSYDQIRISSNKTDNNNKQCGIVSTMYTNNSVSLFQGYFQNGSNTLYYGSADNAHRGITAHIWYVNAGYNATTSHTEAMRINSSGQLLLGISSAYDTDFKMGGTANTGVAVLGTQNSTTGSTHYPAIFRSNGNSTIGSILTSNTATSFNTSSDYRLKDVKGSIQNGLERTLALNPVEFTWKSDGVMSEGFIAHEVQESGWLEGVSGEKDSDKMQEMDYGRITPLLVKAIQEQQEQIEELKTRITALES